MIIEFRVSNHRSIADELAITTAASNRLTADGTDTRPRKIDGLDDHLLPALAFYGANASGKTNVLSAIDFMADAVVHSHRVWEPDGGVPRTPYAWADWSGKESLFEMEFLLESCRYRYGFSVDDQKITEEYLHAYPNGKKQAWFERDGEQFKFSELLQGPNKVIKEITGENSLFLSAASQNRHPKLMPIYTWFRAIETLNMPRRRRPRWPIGRRLSLHRILAAEPEDRSEKDCRMLQRFKDLLKASDFGITDVQREKETESESRYRGSPFRLRHHVKDDDPWLPLDEESNGTQTMFYLGVPLLNALQEGTPLVIDELESSLHPLFATELVKLFNDPVSNPKNAQLIFTTHDSNLLGTALGAPTLRRDQVYLTEKNKSGATEIYPLTDYKPRKTENLERGYLQGRYGAIPFLGQFADLES